MANINVCCLKSKYPSYVLAQRVSRHIGRDVTLIKVAKWMGWRRFLEWPHKLLEWLYRHPMTIGIAHFHHVNIAASCVRSSPPYNGLLGNFDVTSLPDLRRLSPPQSPSLERFWRCDRAHWRCADRAQLDSETLRHDDRQPRSVRCSWPD
jgi:hypothetical protein